MRPVRIPVRDGEAARSRAAFTPASTTRANERLASYLALAYTLAIVYASLSPFSGWRDPGIPAFAFLTSAWPRYLTRFDVVINFVAYLPLGFALFVAQPARERAYVSVILAALPCVALSLLMEAAQNYLPGRISSNLDLLNNSAGAITGAVLAARAGAAPWLARRAARLRTGWFLPGSYVDVGIALLAVWFFSQLDPSLPLLGIRFFSTGIQAQLAGYYTSESARLLGTLSVVLNLTGIGIMLMALMRSRRGALLVIALLVLIATLIKLVAATMLLKRDATFLWVSQDVIIAIGCGFALVGLATLASRRWLPVALAACALASIFVTHLDPGSSSRRLALRFFDWSYGQLLNYTGLASTVAAIWPVLVLAYSLLLYQKRNNRE